MRYISCGPGKRKLRLSFSRDMVEAMCLYHWGERLRASNFDELRICMERWPLHSPQVTTFRLATAYQYDDPDVYRFRQMKGGHRFVVEIPARRFEVRDGAPGRTLRAIKDESRRGITVAFSMYALTDRARRRTEALFAEIYKRDPYADDPERETARPVN